MATHRFTLIVEGPDLQAEPLVDHLYEAGCDDALAGRSHGAQCLDFDREAPSIEEAILSSIHRCCEPRRRRGGAHRRCRPRLDGRTSPPARDAPARASGSSSRGAVAPAHSRRPSPIRAAATGCGAGRRSIGGSKRRSPATSRTARRRSSRPSTPPSSSAASVAACRRSGVGRCRSWWGRRGVGTCYRPSMPDFWSALHVARLAGATG